MYKNNFYISFGVWIVILSLFGIPGAWKNILVFLSGVFLILVSVGPVILKKLQTKNSPPSEGDENGDDIVNKT